MSKLYDSFKTDVENSKVIISSSLLGTQTAPNPSNILKVVWKT